MTSVFIYVHLAATFNESTVNILPKFAWDKEGSTSIMMTNILKICDQYLFIFIFF